MGMPFIEIFFNMLFNIKAVLIPFGSVSLFIPLSTRPSAAVFGALPAAQSAMPGFLVKVSGL